tara:strand:- start:135 stop:860 length:726 start_codon:yes stop_codon:yes gene_type:complete
MKIINIYSPNHDNYKRKATSIKFIILHYTGMQSERESIKRLCNLNSKVSCHYLINRSGKIYRLVNDNKIAWHAGKSCWGKFKNLNKSSIGIELVNKGHKFGYEKFKKKQINSLAKLCKQLKRKYNIKSKNFIGHSDIAPLRKIDPGEKFPWKYLAKKKMGIWHSLGKSLIKKNRGIKILNRKLNTEFFICLNKIGYCFLKKNNISQTKLIKSFQRHFRQELINGAIDIECLIIAKNLLKKH